MNFKTDKVSYKLKHSVENSPEKQVIFENHHEPIIDRETWERVQELRKQRKRPNRYDEGGLFSGILFCADCGSYKKKELETAQKRISELSAIFKRLYEDSVTGRISYERFSELSADYEAEQKELKERAAGLQEELSKAQEATENAEKFMKVVRKHTSFEELTPTLLREFVEKIVIHESVAFDRKRRGKLRRQEIEIYYSFVGKVEMPD